jgi:hypothetical protein
MKRFSVSLLAAAAISVVSGVAFFAGAARRAERPADPPSSEAMARLEEALEARAGAIMERLDRLEAAVDALVRGSRAAREGEPLRRGVPGAEEDAPLAGGPAPFHGEKERPSSSALEEKEAGALRDVVRQVIQEERQERRREDEGRTEEQKMLLQDLSQGPYGKFNLRVNHLARLLNLSERQQQTYHALLADAAERLQEARRDLDKTNPESLRLYQERKKQIPEEFDGMVIRSLSPPQAQAYLKLHDFERSPEVEAAVEAMPKVILSRAKEEER